LEVMQERAQQRSMIVYDAIDSSGGFYVNTIPASCRSRMNVVFSLRDAALTDLFVRAAEGNGLANLRGHRLVGGLRASLYNAMPVEGAKALASFMGEFAQRHG
ncbi:MAG: phosphoserine transaminase, partial [Duodenibacillus sp.]|nr:phosphoserine transaminase [Duodenibacillus sp.]